MNNDLLIKILNRDDRLVIPGFGAILCKEMPQGKVNAFTPFLKKDDGKLNQALVEEFGVTAEDAAVMINEYVAHIHENISSKGRFEMDGVGVLSADANGAILLEERLVSLREAEKMPAAEATRRDEMPMPDPVKVAQPDQSKSTPVEPTSEITYRSDQDRVVDLNQLTGAVHSQPSRVESPQLGGVSGASQASRPVQQPLPSQHNAGMPAHTAQPQQGARCSSNVVQPGGNGARPIPNILSGMQGGQPVRPVVTRVSPVPSSSQPTQQPDRPMPQQGAVPPQQRPSQPQMQGGQPHRPMPIQGQPSGTNAPRPQGGKPMPRRNAKKTDVWLITAVIAAAAVLGLMIYGYVVSNQTVDIEPLVEDTISVVVE